jgi:uncharacterized membrane protein YkvA (DUF1232 family)
MNGKKHMIQSWINQFTLTWRLLKDERVPITAKLVPVLVGIYVAFPFDIIPDFIPIIGQLDDLVIIMMGMRLFERVAPPAIVAQHRADLGME